MATSSGSRWLTAIHRIGYVTTGLVAVVLGWFVYMMVSEAISNPRKSCVGIKKSTAISMARDAKRDMLSRSRDAEKNDFASNAVESVERLENGGAGIVGVVFVGKSHRTLEALIYDDCYIGWTGTG